MTPIFFFFTICVTFSGGDNCEYDFEMVSDHGRWTALHHDYQVETPLNSTHGFTVPWEKQVYVRDDTYRQTTIEHEIKHVSCILEFPDNPNPCHRTVDATESKTRDGIHDEEKCKWFKDNGYYDKNCP